MRERAKTTEHMACKGCRWFDPFPNRDEGECRRMSPAPAFTASLDDSTNDIDVSWPEVDEDDWCGEFRPINDPPCVPCGTGNNEE